MSDIDMCSACGYMTEVKEYKDHTNPEREMKFCIVCRRTFIGNAYQYHYEHELLYRSLGYCTNLILSAITGVQVK